MVQKKKKKIGKEGVLEIILKAGEGHNIMSCLHLTKIQTFDVGS